MVSVVISPENENDLWVQWSDPRLSNYHPPITAVEIQLKQNRLFDSWKTIETLQLSENPFKEATSNPTNQILFEEGEMTDVESDSDLEERRVVEFACIASDPTLERRREVSNVGRELNLHCLLPPLVGKQTYQVRVRCANKYGWGDYEDGVTFSPSSGT